MPEDLGWPLHRAEPGEAVDDAVTRVRSQGVSPFYLECGGIRLAVQSSATPLDILEAYRRARDEGKTRTIPLIGGPYDGRVRIPSGWPHDDVILVGPDMVRYEAVREPDGMRRLCFVHVPATG